MLNVIRLNVEAPTKRVSAKDMGRKQRANVLKLFTVVLFEFL
jgi:hypothetical protein